LRLKLQIKQVKSINKKQKQYRCKAKPNKNKPTKTKPTITKPNQGKVKAELTTQTNKTKQTAADQT
jgi:hypothetical protein